jgi:hypothetical protein
MTNTEAEDLETLLRRGMSLSWSNANESDTLLTCLVHAILRHNVDSRVRDNKVQSSETGSPRLDKPDFQPFARFLRIPVVDKLLQTLLPSLCPGDAEIVPDEACQHAYEEIQESAESECVESRFHAGVEVGDQEAEIAF